MKKIIAKIVLICMVGMAILIGYFIYQHKVNMNALENIPGVEKMKAPYTDYKPKSTQPSKKATVSKKETSTTAPSTTAPR